MSNMAGEVRNGAKKFTRIPAKWRDYSVCGKVIPGERLVSFKTPLSEEYHCHGNERNPEDCLQKDEQFTPSDLCNIFRKRGHILGLVVDFTNTKRYYQAQEFTKREIEYKKIKCEGKIVPPDKVVHKCVEYLSQLSAANGLHLNYSIQLQITFKATILSFLKKFPNSASVVGVHCTHGLNRAGYIVCRYLIECRGHSPQKAIEVFNKARGHKMERENYLEDLQQRKPKKLSEEDIEYLIETSPPSDDEYQPDRHWKRDYRGGYNQSRRDTFRPAIPEPRGSTGGKRGYRRRFEDRYVEHQDNWGYGEENYDDDRDYGRRFVGDTWRYQSNERGNLKYERDSYTDQDRFNSYDRYETDPSYDSRFDSYSRDNDRFHREERRHRVERRRPVDRRHAGRYHHPHYKGHSTIDGNYGNYEEPAHYRERDDRSRTCNREQTRGYRSEYRNNKEY